MFKNVGWTLGNDCPCNCQHCYSMKVRNKGKNLSKEIVDRVIKEILSVGAETVNFGGNEPIFTNGLNVNNSLLPYIISECTNNNLQIGITSSGISIINLQKYYENEFKMLNDVDVSIDSPNKNEHNINRGADVFDMAIEALDICEKYNIPHSIVMCAMKWNFTVDRIQQLCKLANKYNANIRINLFKPVKLEHLNMMPSIQQLKDGYNYLLSNCYTIDMSDPVLAGKFDNNIISGCSCGTNSLRINSITPDGKIPVSPCVYMHDYQVGDLLIDSLIDIVNSKEFKEFQYRKNNYDNISGCKNCEKINICRGGCAASAYWYNYYKNGVKDILSKDPYCIIDDETLEKPSITHKKTRNLVHENYLCTWIGKPM